MKRLLLAYLLLLFITSQQAKAGDSSFDKAVDLYNHKNYRAAAPIFYQVMTSHPDSPTAFYYEGLCLQQLGDNDRAKQYYQTLVNTFPASAEAKLASPVLQKLGSPTGGTAGNKNSPSAKVIGVVNPATTNGTSELTTSMLPKDAGAAIEFVKHVTLSDAEWKKLPTETKIPFVRGTSTHLFLDGYLNGRPLRMMFDTGAENCHFSRRELEGAGIKVDKGGPIIPVTGVAGNTKCTMMVANITIGDITRRLPILVSEEDVGYPIVGESFFKDFRYELDNSQGFIHFIKKNRPGMTSHVYESTDVIKIPFENAGNNMVVQAKVNGQSIPMYFDTGAQTITLSALHALQLHLAIPPDAQVAAISGAGGTVRAYMFYVDRIELGPIVKTHVQIVVNDAMTPPLPLLGQPFYKDRRFTIDNDEHVIKFVH